MELRQRRALTGRKLLTVGSLAGFAVFFVLVLDGAELLRSGLAGVATAVWIMAMIAGLNWYNRLRAEGIAQAVAQATPDGDYTEDGALQNNPEPPR